MVQSGRKDRPRKGRRRGSECKEAVARSSQRRWARTPRTQARAHYQKRTKKCWPGGSYVMLALIPARSARRNGSASAAWRRSRTNSSSVVTSRFLRAHHPAQASSRATKCVAVRVKVISYNYVLPSTAMDHHSSGMCVAIYM
jgi:hypothetical protein